MGAAVVLGPIGAFVRMFPLPGGQAFGLAGLTIGFLVERRVAESGSRRGGDPDR